MKYVANVSGSKSFKIETKGNELCIEDRSVDVDFIKIDNQWSLIYDNKSYNIKLVEFNLENKTIIIDINNKEVEVSILNQNDLLLKEMNIDIKNKKNITSLKAPMPGLIIKINVENGQEVKKGDTLLVLEAMKMENVIKSPADLVIKQVLTSPKEAVEKDQTLIKFV
jgi:biotin carboxyl carrier protein